MAIEYCAVVEYVAERWGLPYPFVGLVELAPSLSAAMQSAEMFALPADAVDVNLMVMRRSVSRNFDGRIVSCSDWQEVEDLHWS